MPSAQRCSGWEIGAAAAPNINARLSAPVCSEKVRGGVRAGAGMPDRPWSLSITWRGVSGAPGAEGADTMEDTAPGDGAWAPG